MNSPLFWFSFNYDKALALNSQVIICTSKALAFIKIKVYN